MAAITSTQEAIARAKAWKLATLGSLPRNLAREVALYSGNTRDVATLYSTVRHVYKKHHIKMEEANQTTFKRDLACDIFDLLISANPDQAGLIRGLLGDRPTHDSAAAFLKRFDSACAAVAPEGKIYDARCDSGKILVDHEKLYVDFFNALPRSSYGLWGNLRIPEDHPLSSVEIQEAFNEAEEDGLLSSVSVLKLKNNGLTKLPKEVDMLKGVVSYNFGNNPIEGIPKCLRGRKLSRSIYLKIKAGYCKELVKRFEDGQDSLSELQKKYVSELIFSVFGSSRSTPELHRLGYLVNEEAGADLIGEAWWHYHEENFDLVNPHAPIGHFYPVIAHPPAILHFVLNQFGL